MTKITTSMLKALQRIDGPGIADVRFRTGEALRRRGLAGRLSTYVVKRIYVSKDGAINQFPDGVSAKNPVIWHEWYITAEGKQALRERNSS